MTKFVNLTPHAVTVYNNDGEVTLTIPGAENPLRMQTVSVDAGEMAGVPVVRNKFRLPDDLPPQANGTIYIVPAMMLQPLAEAGRHDFVAPDTSPASAVRDDQGRIIGVRRFVRA